MNKSHVIKLELVDKIVYKKISLFERIFTIIKMSRGHEFGENDDTEGGGIDLDFSGQNSFDGFPVGHDEK